MGVRCLAGPLNRLQTVFPVVTILPEKISLPQLPLSLHTDNRGPDVHQIGQGGGQVLKGKVEAVAAPKDSVLQGIGTNPAACAGEGPILDCVVPQVCLLYTSSPGALMWPGTAPWNWWTMTWTSVCALIWTRCFKMCIRDRGNSLCPSRVNNRPEIVLAELHCG